MFRLASGAAVTFNDPRRFGSMKLVARAKLEQEPLLRAIGPEPLGNEFDAAMLAKACAGKKTSLKAALSDQRVVAGLGNIYVCEALYRARLSPKRQASTIADRNGRLNAHAEVLVQAIKAVLNDAIKAGGSSLREGVAQAVRIMERTMTTDTRANSLVRIDLLLRTDGDPNNEP